MPASKTHLKTKKVLLLGSFGQQNFGDEELLKTLHAFLQKHSPNLAFTANYSLVKPKLPAKSNMQFFKTYNLFDLVRAIFKNDVIILCGGTAIKTLPQSVNRNRYSTLFMLAVVSIFVKLLRKPYLFYSIGVSGLPNSFARFLAKIILWCASSASVRDSDSRQLAKSLTPKKPITHTGDGTLLQLYEKTQSSTRVAPKGMDTLTVNFVSGISDSLDLQTYHQSILKLTNRAASTHGLKNIKLLTLQTMDARGSERHLYAEIFKKSEYEEISMDSFLDKYRGSPAILSRYHAMIYALAYKIPFWGLAYDSKCAALLQDAGYPYWVAIQDTDHYQASFDTYLNDLNNAKITMVEAESYLKWASSKVTAWTVEEIIQRHLA